MLIDCPGCEVQVEAEPLGAFERQDKESDDSPWRVTLVQCPRCGGPLLGSQQMVEVQEGEWDWSGAETLWPPMTSWLDWELPGAVRDCLDEAQRCFKAKAFSAGAVMVGLALEAISVEHTGEKPLGRGLRALRDSGVIDHRLFDWSESLREDGSLATQAPGHRTSAQDARELMDFVLALCEYIYVYSNKYAQYRARRPARASSTAGDRQTASEPAAPASTAAPDVEMANGSLESGAIETT
jgi:hypothetical protein